MLQIIHVTMCKESEVMDMTFYLNKAIEEQTEYDERALVYIRKDTVDKYMEAGSIDDAEKIVLLESRMLKSQILNTIEELDEDLVAFKHKQMVYKKSFKEAVLSSEKEIDELFSRLFDKENELIKKLNSTVQPFEKLLRDVSEKDKELRIYSFASEIEKLYESLKLFSNLYGENKNIIEFLVENYSKGNLKKVVK